MPALLSADWSLRSAAERRRGCSQQWEASRGLRLCRFIHHWHSSRCNRLRLLQPMPGHTRAHQSIRRCCSRHQLCNIHSSIQDSRQRLRQLRDCQIHRHTGGPRLSRLADQHYQEPRPGPTVHPRVWWNWPQAGCPIGGIRKDRHGHRQDARRDRARQLYRQRLSRRDDARRVQRMVQDLQ